jgi:hypothetical protein
MNLGCVALRFASAPWQNLLVPTRFFPTEFSEARAMIPQFSIKKFALSIFLSIVFSAPVFAQSDPWVHANPVRIVPHDVAVFSCGGQTTANVRWIFGDAGYRVIQTPVVTRSGNTISLDARVEEFTGGRAQVVTPFEKNFDLGTLEPGTYTLIVKSWDTPLKQIQFTIVATPPAPLPVDAPCSFVTQHYRDFLSRDPDGNGFAFWINELVNCGMNTQCLDVKRINVSAAFFLSIESRETGYYVYRMYRAALGRRPTFAEFVPEAAQLGKNVVVGSDDPWSIRLSSNKDIYTSAFFNRSDFQARYAGLTSAQYVDKLFETEGITPPTTERADLINSLDNCHFTIGCPTRANILRRIVENPAFDRKVFNEAFVTMQYFGYLRRDPDEAGFNFWLAKLNQFNGDYIAAEMVKAFIRSDEYRRRF